MEQEKQIEEMESIIFESSPVPSVWRSDAHKMAKALYNADYRKVILCKDCMLWDSDKKFCRLMGLNNSIRSNINENCFCFEAKMKGAE